MVTGEKWECEQKKEGKGWWEEEGDDEEREGWSHYY